MDNKPNPLSLLQERTGEEMKPLDNMKAILRQQAEMELAELQPKSTQQSPYNELGGSTEGMGEYDPNAQQRSILPSKFAVTQKFMNYNPEIEKYSGGYNYGVDFGTPENTPVALPSGRWVVKEATMGSFNKGYGNSVLAVNEETGEQLRFSHLSKLNAVPGMRIQGGSVVGFTGNTGNSTGPHLDIEAYSQNGKPIDILQSRYARELYGN